MVYDGVYLCDLVQCGCVSIIQEYQIILRVLRRWMIINNRTKYNYLILRNRLLFYLSINCHKKVKLRLATLASLALGVNHNFVY